MDTKAYKPKDEEPRIVSEPAITYYQDTSDVYCVTDEERESILIGKGEIERGEYITQEEMDKQMKEWLREK